MKTRIALTVLTIVVLVVTGCAGTGSFAASRLAVSTRNFDGCVPAAVDRHGNMQADAQTIKISAYNGAFTDFGKMAVDESFGSLTKFGYNESQIRQMLMAVDMPNSQNSRPALFGANSLLSDKLSLPFVMPYNHDGSITLFWLPDMQVRFMPMVSFR